MRSYTTPKSLPTPHLRVEVMTPLPGEETTKAKRSARPEKQSQLRRWRLSEKGDLNSLGRGKGG